MHNNYMTTANTPQRTPDCVTTAQVGKTILTVSGFFKQDGGETAVDKMMKVLEVEHALSAKTDQ